VCKNKENEFKLATYKTMKLIVTRANDCKTYDFGGNI
jgi:hypothetical protein